MAKAFDYTRAEKERLSVEDMLPNELFSDPRCYDSFRYHEWENEVATPALQKLGYEVDYWWNEDADSFGPLVRAVGLRKDGKVYVAVCG